MTDLEKMVDSMNQMTEQIYNLQRQVAASLWYFAMVALAN